jgi:uncharacterized lipoprotein
MRMGIVLFSALVAGACVFNPQDVQIQPVVSVASSDIGHGAPVGVRVVDERSSQIIGHRGMGMQVAEIRSSQDVAATVETVVSRGVKDMGFSPIAFSRDQLCTLTVEIRDIGYSTAQGFWTAGIYGRAALKAVVANHTDVYEKLYRAEYEERTMVAPTSDYNEKLINEAVSSNIGQMLSDQQLVRTLAGGFEHARHRYQLGEPRGRKSLVALKPPGSVA